MYVIVDPATGIVLGLAANKAMADEGHAIARYCLGLSADTRPITEATAASLLANVTMQPVPMLEAT